MSWRSPQNLLAYLTAPLLGGLLLGSSVQAAEQVVLKYGVWQDTVPVAELETLAATGEASPALAFYLKLANKQPADLQKILTRPVKADPVTLDRVLNSAPGEMLLDELGTIIQTPTGAANRQALRATMVLSASDDRQVTLLETIQNYPTSELHIDGKNLERAYGTFAKIERPVRQVEERLRQLEKLLGRFWR